MGARTSTPRWKPWRPKSRGTCAARGAGLLHKLQGVSSRCAWTPTTILAKSGCGRCGLQADDPDKRAQGWKATGSRWWDGRPVRASPQNLRYLRTKRDRMGHDLPGLDEDGGASAGPASRWWTAQAREKLPVVSGEGRPAMETRVGCGRRQELARRDRGRAVGAHAAARRAWPGPPSCGRPWCAGSSPAPTTPWWRSARWCAAGRPHFEYVCDSVTAGLTPGCLAPTRCCRWATGLAAGASASRPLTAPAVWQHEDGDFVVVAVLQAPRTRGCTSGSPSQIAMVAIEHGGVLLLGPRYGPTTTASRCAACWSPCHGRLERVAFPDGASWARLELIGDDYLPMLAIQAVSGQHQAGAGAARRRRR